MKWFLRILFIGGLLAGLASCKKDSNPVSSDLSTSTPTLKLGEVYASGTKIELYADDSLTVGYNTVYFKLTDSLTGTALSQSAISLIPTMVMPTMSHSSPVESPDTSATNEYFQGAVSFLMAGGTVSSGSYWKLSLAFTNRVNGKSDTAVFAGIPVTAPALTRLKSFTASDDNTTKIYVSLIPHTPQVGSSNSFEVLANYKASMQSFPALNTLAFGVKPWMPDMGHGSDSTGLSLTSSSNGHYKGTVSYTMTGTWIDTVIVRRNGTQIGTVFFEIDL